MKYNPSDAAKACNVSVNTVRGWIRDYGQHFSAAARGESGNRLLSDKDMNTLKYIAQLRSEGLQKDAIGVRLQETAIGDVETIVPLQSTSITQPASPESHSDAPLMLAVVNDLQTQVRALQQARQEDKQNRQSQTLIFLLGLTAGIVLTVGLLAVAALTMR